MAQRVYCIDSCSLIDAWANYPISHFEDLWAGLESLIKTRRLIAPDEVKRELKDGDDACSEWACRQTGLFAPMDAEQQMHVRTIGERFPGLVDQVGRKSLADPWIIALAKLKGAQVVTQEKGRKNPLIPKIPDVCRELGIHHGRFIGIIKNENWTFQRRK